MKLLYRFISFLIWVLNSIFFYVSAFVARVLKGSMVRNHVMRLNVHHSPLTTRVTNEINPSDFQFSSFFHNGYLYQSTQKGQRWTNTGLKKDNRFDSTILSDHALNRHKERLRNAPCGRSTSTGESNPASILNDNANI